MDWTQALTIIGSILIPMLAGFGWMISRMDKKFEAINSELKSQGERVARIEGAIWSNFRTGTEK